MTNYINNRNTPEPIKRILRRESGFGCCICGNPIIQYHHIIPWEKEQHFRDSDMMCLCPNHHDKASKGALTEEEQRKFKAKPFNIQKGWLCGNLEINKNIPVINVGTCQFVGEGDFFIVDKESLLSLNVLDGQLNITIKLYNKKDDLVLYIDNNEWITGDFFPWDIESDYQKIKIRHKNRDIPLCINTGGDFVDINAKLWRKGSSFNINNKRITYNGVVKDVSFAHLCFVGMSFLIETDKEKLVLHPLLKESVFISWSNVKERIVKGLEAWEKLKIN